MANEMFTYEPVAPSFQYSSPYPLPIGDSAYWQKQLDARDKLDRDYINQMIQEKGRPWVDQQRAKGTLDVPSMRQNASSVLGPESYVRPAAMESQAGDFTVRPGDVQSARDYYEKRQPMTQDERIFEMTPGEWKLRPEFDPFDPGRYNVSRQNEAAKERFPPTAQGADSPKPAAQQDDISTNWSQMPQESPNPGEDVLRAPTTYERNIKAFDIIPGHKLWRKARAGDYSHTEQTALPDVSATLGEILTLLMGGGAAAGKMLNRTLTAAPIEKQAAQKAGSSIGDYANYWLSKPKPTTPKEIPGFEEFIKAPMQRPVPDSDAIMNYVRGIANQTPTSAEELASYLYKVAHGMVP